MLHYLDLHEICVSSGSACNAKRTETSHVLRAIGLPEFLAQGTLRITYGYENTQEEAIQLAKAIVAGYGKLKR